MFEISLPWLHLFSYNSRPRYLKSSWDLLYYIAGKVTNVIGNNNELCLESSLRIKPEYIAVHSDAVEPLWQVLYIIRKGKKAEKKLNAEKKRKGKSLTAQKSKGKRIGHKKKNVLYAYTLHAVNTVLSKWKWFRMNIFPASKQWGGIWMVL